VRVGLKQKFDMFTFFLSVIRVQAFKFFIMTFIFMLCLDLGTARDLQERHEK
jgi:hypothetical protein